jgi:hypothetical protein
MPHTFRVAASCLAATLVAAVILTGCGGSGAKEPAAQTVSGQGFRFDAPAGWKVTVGKQRASASHDDELLQVAAFPLQKRYSPALFAEVERELQARMKQVAAETGGTVSDGGDVTAGGIRSHTYRLKVGDHVDEYTFVLRGMREYQLLCRRKASSDDSNCRQLVASFKVV